MTTAAAGTLERTMLCALVPALAHVMELPNKMRLPREAYLTVQSIYRGWALVGILVV